MSPDRKSYTRKLTQKELDEFREMARQHTINRVMNWTMCDQVTAEKWIKFFADTTGRPEADWSVGDKAINAIMKEHGDEHRP